VGDVEQEAVIFPRFVIKEWAAVSHVGTYIEGLSEQTADEVIWLQKGHVARMGEKRNVYRLLVRKPEGKRPLGRPRRRWIDNIKIDLFEIGVNVVDWIGLAQDRYRWRALVNSVMNLRVP
jgi:hypothetical protein